MTGQEAVDVASEFAAHVPLDGIVLTKIDGDARGGAALSVKEVIGLPIVFAGVGEKLDDFEPFHPDRMASRILGMGDVLTLIEKAEAVFDADQAQAAEAKLRSGQFTLEDFLDQMRQMKKMGPLQSIVGMMPGVPEGAPQRRDRRARAREGRGDHLLDDPRRAPRPLDHQRVPPPPHRPRQRHQHLGGQRDAQAVQDGPADDADHERQRIEAPSPRRPARALAPATPELARPRLKARPAEALPSSSPTRKGPSVAVKIRLLRVGKTKQPSYRVVVADSRSPRDGRIIETIGHYGPRAEPSGIQINEDRALAWLRQGAQPTEQVQKLLTVTGVWGTYAAERTGPIVTKLNRRGYVTGRGPKPAPAADAPAPKAAAKAAPKPAAAEAAPAETDDAPDAAPDADEAGTEEPSE